jgi:hypothetical protein
MEPALHRKLEAELRAAESARGEGEEGKARVHARRAAGWAAADYFHRVVGPSQPNGATECLRWFANRSELPAELREAARRLTVHVTVDHVLPHSEDPLADARMIVDNLAQSMA